MILSISGPSAAGKSLLLEQINEYYKSASMLPFLALESITTRPRRSQGEGVENYVFVSDAEFSRLKLIGELAWHVQPHGLPYRYGTRHSALTAAISSEEYYASILTPDKVDALHDVARDIGKSANVRSIYLFIDDGFELRRRFEADKRADVENRLDFSKVNADAKKVRAPLYYINATQSPESVLREAIFYLSTFKYR